MNTLSLATLFQTQRFLDAFHYAQRGIGTRMQMGMFKFLYRDRKWDESIKITHAFADRYVDKALEYRQDHFAKNEDINKRYVLLQEIVKKTDDRIELRSQIIHVFLAGHDSTAITIGNAIFHLCRHQYMWEKLRAEVLATEGAPLTFGALKNMRYLQYIVKESKSSSMFCKKPSIHTGSRPRDSSSCSKISHYLFFLRTRLSSREDSLPVRLSCSLHNRPGLIIIAQTLVLK